MYDISERKSFENAAVWFDRARQLGGDQLVSLLIGNKTDLPAEDRQVSFEEGFALANKLGMYVDSDWRMYILSLSYHTASSTVTSTVAVILSIAMSTAFILVCTICTI